MNKVKKILAVITLLGFSLSNISSYAYEVNSYKLAAPSSFSNLKGPEFKDAAQIRAGILEELKKVEVFGLSSVKAIGRKDFSEKSVFGYSQRHVRAAIYFDEAMECRISDNDIFIESGNYIFRAVNEQNGDTYYCLVSKKVNGPGYDISVVPERILAEAQRKGTVKFTHDSINKKDKDIIELYLEHEVSTENNTSIDEWIRQRMESGEYAVDNVGWKNHIFYLNSKIYPVLSEHYAKLVHSIMNELGRVGVEREGCDKIKKELSEKPLVIIPYGKETDLPMIKIGYQRIRVRAHSSQFATYIFLKRDELDEAQAAIEGSKNPNLVFSLIRPLLRHEVGAICGLPVTVNKHHMAWSELDEAIAASSVSKFFTPSARLVNMAPVDLFDLELRSDYAAGDVEKKGVFKRVMAVALASVVAVGGYLYYKFTRENPTEESQAVALTPQSIMGERNETVPVLSTPATQPRGDLGTEELPAVALKSQQIPGLPQDKATTAPAAETQAEINDKMKKAINGLQEENSRTSDSAIIDIMKMALLEEVSIEDLRNKALPLLKKHAERRGGITNEPITVIEKGPEKYVSDLFGNGEFEKRIQTVRDRLPDGNTLTAREEVVDIILKRMAKAEGTIPILIKLLEKRTLGYQEEADIILVIKYGGNQAAKDATPVLIKKLEITAPGTRMFWEELLLRTIDTIGLAGPTAKDAVPELIKRVEERQDSWDKASGSVTRYAAVRALGNIGPASKDALPILQQIADAYDDYMGKAAIEAIEKIQGKPFERRQAETPEQVKERQRIAKIKIVISEALHDMSQYKGDRSWGARLAGVVDIKKVIIEDPKLIPELKDAVVPALKELLKTEKNGTSVDNAAEEALKIIEQGPESYFASDEAKAKIPTWILQVSNRAHQVQIDARLMLVSVGRPALRPIAQTIADNDSTIFKASAPPRTQEDLDWPIHVKRAFCLGIIENIVLKNGDIDDRSIVEVLVNAADVDMKNRKYIAKILKMLSERSNIKDAAQKALNRNEPGPELQDRIVALIKRLDKKNDDTAMRRDNYGLDSIKDALVEIGPGILPELRKIAENEKNENARKIIMEVIKEIERAQAQKKEPAKGSSMLTPRSEVAPGSRQQVEAAIPALARMRADESSAQADNITDILWRAAIGAISAGEAKAELEAVAPNIGTTQAEKDMIHDRWLALAARAAGSLGVQRLARRSKPGDEDIRRQVASRLKNAGIEVFVRKSQFPGDTIATYKEIVESMGNKLRPYQKVEDLEGMVTDPSKSIIMTTDVTEPESAVLEALKAKAPALRFMNFAQMEDLDKMEPVEFENYQADVLSILLLARVITPEDIKDNGNITYQLLLHLLEEYMPEGTTVDSYIKDIVANAARLIKTILKALPATAYKTMRQAVEVLWAA
jgi:hypothetical protein